MNNKKNPEFVLHMYFTVNYDDKELLKDFVQKVEDKPFPGDSEEFIQMAKSHLIRFNVLRKHDKDDHLVIDYDFFDREKENES